MKNWENPKLGKGRFFLQAKSCLKNKSFSKKNLKFWETEKEFPWALMRRTRIPNFIPIERWKRGEKSEKPKTGENKILVLSCA